MSCKLWGFAIINLWQHKKQIEYFDKALGIKVDDDIWGKWVEIKARRDLWVHNAGIVNQVYIDKVRDS